MFRAILRIYSNFTPANKNLCGIKNLLAEICCFNTQNTGTCLAN